ncbi:hypothetical protein ACCT09_25955, partial [Rhizobium ruizarguesonis]
TTLFRSVRTDPCRGSRSALAAIWKGSRRARTLPPSHNDMDSPRRLGKPASFRGIDPMEPDSLAGDLDRVAVDHCRATDELLGVGRCGSDDQS